MLFTDIEGSTRLLKQLGERYGDLLSDHRRLLRAAFAAHSGREIDTQGDAFFVAFARARDGVEAAIEGQRALAAHEWPNGVECRVRMGLHTGEPSVLEEGYHGIGLHRGARIMSAAHGGQVLVSSATAELIQDDLPAGVTLRDLGRQPLKDIDRLEHLYQLVADGLQAQFPPARTARKSRRGAWIAIAAASVLVLAAVATVIIATRGGSGSATASAAPISADAVGILNPRTGSVIGQVPVGASPNAVAACDGSIWTTNGDARSVSRVNATKQVMIANITVGNGPDGIACGDGFIWVANGLDGTVTKIDPQIDQPVDTIDVGNGPAGVAVGLGYVWVANSNDGTLSGIDLRTDKPLPAIPIGQSADGVTVGFNSVWVTDQVSGTVTRVEARSGSTIPIEAGGGADAVTTGVGSVWVANSLGDTVTRIDPATNTPRAGIPVGEGPNGLAVVDSSVWVSDGLAGTLTKINAVSGSPSGPVKTGNRPEGLVVDSRSLFVAVSSSGLGHFGGTLTVLTSPGYLDNVDPARAYSLPDGQVAVLTHDGLVGFRRVGGNAGLKLVPDLAVSIPAPTDGGLTYSFQLRPNIHYSTGALVRPEDFRHAIERTLELSRQGAYYAPYYAGIIGARRCLADPKRPCDLSQGIETHAGSSTITFHLVSPDADFLNKLDLPAAFAVPAGTPLHPHGFVPATGPYEIASFDPATGIRLVRNPRFREWSAEAQPNGFPDVIVENVRGSADAHIDSVLDGSADLAGGENRPPVTKVASVRTQHASDLVINPWIITYFLALNTHFAPFDDMRVRQALNFAVDRTRLLDLAFGPGLGSVTCQVLPPGLLGYRPYCPYTSSPNSTGTWTAPDLARARQLVRASGTAGQRVTVWLATDPHFRSAAARYVVSVLDELGYKARLRHTPDGFDEDKLHIQAIFSGWFPDFPAPSGMIEQTLTCASYTPMSSENLNEAEFCDRSIDREIARAQTLEPGDPAAARLWIKIDHDLTDQAPWLSFANGVTIEVKSPRVGNYQYNPQWGTLLGQLWVR
jgi:YVTN family beta-propeller protein